MAYKGSPSFIKWSWRGEGNVPGTHIPAKDVMFKSIHSLSLPSPAYSSKFSYTAEKKKKKKLIPLTLSNNNKKG